MAERKNSDDELNKEEPLPKKKYMDELEMQQSGFVDKKGRHVPTVIDENSPNTVGTNDSKVVYGARQNKGVDMIAAMRYKYEYLEYRVGDKGQAMTIWDDGGEFIYNFTGDTLFQIPPTYSKKPEKLSSKKISSSKDSCCVGK